MRETEGVEGREMREGVRRGRRRWGEPGERLERQQNVGESKRRAAAIEFRRGTWLNGTG